MRDITKVKELLARSVVLARNAELNARWSSDASREALAILRTDDARETRKKPSLRKGKDAAIWSAATPYTAGDDVMYVTKRATPRKRPAKKGRR